MSSKRSRADTVDGLIQERLARAANGFFNDTFKRESSPYVAVMQSSLGTEETVNRLRSTDDWTEEKLESLVMAYVRVLLKRPEDTDIETFARIKEDSDLFALTSALYIAALFRGGALSSYIEGKITKLSESSRDSDAEKLEMWDGRFAAVEEMELSITSLEKALVRLLVGSDEISEEAQAQLDSLDLLVEEVEVDDDISASAKVGRLAELKAEREDIMKEAKMHAEQDALREAEGGIDSLTDDFE